MSIAATLASQCLVMFAVMGLGCLLVKLGMLSPTTTRELGSLLLNVVFPVVIVRSFWGMYTPERLNTSCSPWCCPPSRSDWQCSLRGWYFPAMASSSSPPRFPTPGSLGFPWFKRHLEPRRCSSSHLYRGSQCLAVDIRAVAHLRLHREHQHALRPEQPHAHRTHPRDRAVLGSYARSPHCPNPHGTIANLNSPLAMLILGSYLANADLRALLTSPKAYKASVARLVLIPLTSIALFAAIPGAREVKLAILIAAAAPVAPTSPSFANSSDRTPKSRASRSAFPPCSLW